MNLRYTYIIGVIVLFGFFILVAIIKTLDPGPSDLPKAFFVHENGQSVIYQQAIQGNDWDHPSPFAVALYLTYHNTGPLPHLIEFYESKSMFAHPVQFNMFKNQLGDDEIQLLRDQLIAFAKADPQVSSYNPGEQPTTQFSIKLTALTLLRLTLIFGLPRVVIWGLKKRNSQQSHA